MNAALLWRSMLLFEGSCVVCMWVWMAPCVSCMPDVHIWLRQACQFAAWLLGGLLGGWLHDCWVDAQLVCAVA